MMNDIEDVRVFGKENASNAAWGGIRSRLPSCGLAGNKWIVKKSAVIRRGALNREWKVLVGLKWGRISVGFRAFHPLLLRSGMRSFYALTVADIILRGC